MAICSAHSLCGNQSLSSYWYHFSFGCVLTGVGHGIELPLKKRKVDNGEQSCPRIGYELYEEQLAVFQVLFLANQPRGEDIQLPLCDDPELFLSFLQTLRLEGGVT